MTPQRPRIEKGWRYENAEASALALEALLAKHGIGIKSGSAFERHVLSVLHLVDQKRAGLVRGDQEDFRPYYRTLIGVHEFARLILEVKDSPEFVSFLPHLELLNEGEVLQKYSVGWSRSGNE